jgi:hypothetical protein
MLIVDKFGTCIMFVSALMKDVNGLKSLFDSMGALGGKEEYVIVWHINVQHI